jgi:O-antigen ligase
LTRERYITSLLALSGVIAALTGVATTSNVKLLCIVAFVLGALLSGFPRQVMHGRALLFFLFTVLVVISLERTDLTRVRFVSHNAILRQELFAIGAAWFLASALWGRTELWERRRNAALLAPGVLVVTNLALWAIGFHFGPKPPNAGQAEMLTHLGFQISRQTLPLTPGINSAGDVAAIAAAMSFVLLRSGGSRRFHLSVIAASLATIGLTDARGSLLYVLVAVAAVAFTPGFAKRAAVAVPVLIPLLPSILLVVLSRSSGYTSALNHGGDVTTATGRSFIWRAIYDHLGKPHFADLFGYGYYGQITSGVSYQYAFLFRYQPIPESASAHNMLLQTILDSGYVGAVVTVALLSVGIWTVSQRYTETLSSWDLATVIGLLVLVLLGTTETVPTIYFPESFVLALLLLCVALRARRDVDEPHAALPAN